MPIYRLLMSAWRPDSLLGTRKWAEIDFFVGALDEVEAGSRLHDALHEIGWTPADYILLPTEVNALDSINAEFATRIQQAREVGEAMIVRPIDEPPHA